jgi:hypothetical protein
MMNDATSGALEHFLSAPDEDLANFNPIMGVEDAADLTLQEAIAYARVGRAISLSANLKFQVFVARGVWCVVRGALLS